MKNRRPWTYFSKYRITAYLEKSVPASSLRAYVFYLIGCFQPEALGRIRVNSEKLYDEEV